MLEVEERYMMKDLHRKGVSISEIARQTGRDRKTVRKAITGELIPERRRPEQERVRKITPFEGYLQQRMTEGVFNTRKLFRELQERGYEGGLTQVIEYVQPFRPPREGQATIRFETEPGQQAQVDWASFGHIQHEGRKRSLYIFLMTLGWSRMQYVEYTVSMDTGWFLRCHQHAFEYFGGVPREVLHDNLKSAVLDRDADGRIHWNPRYLDFALTTGFTPRAHKPYRPQTKGKVESGVRYVRVNFWPGIHFEDLDDLNAQALEWLNRVANCRIHGTTGEMPFQRWPHENLHPLPLHRFDTSILTQRRSGKDCLVSYQGNFYSVPARYAQQILLLKETEEGWLLIFNAQGEQVAEHRLLPGHRQRAIVEAHYAGLPGAKVARVQSVPVLSPREASISTVTPWPAPEVEVRPLSVYAHLLEDSHD
jgi:transposase